MPHSLPEGRNRITFTDFEKIFDLFLAAVTILNLLSGYDMELSEGDLISSTLLEQLPGD